MLAPKSPANEKARIAELHALSILDSAPEERFDRLTRLAAGYFKVSVALIVFLDSDRQWFKSHFGLDLSETSRDISFCGHAILANDTFVVPDTLKDENFADNPLVTGDPYIRFYAGHPLKGKNNTNLGTLCVIDQKPRSFSDQDKAALRTFVNLVELELERESFIDTLKINHKAERMLEQFFLLSPDMLCIADFEGNFLKLNPAWEHCLGWTNDELKSEPFLNFVHPDDRDNTVSEYEKLLSGGVTIFFENRYRTRTGEYIWVEWSSAPLVDLKVIFAVARDVTDRKEAEAAEIARQTAEAANTAKNAFLAVLSHELRTPLHTIMGMAQLAREQSSNLNELLDPILNASDQLHKTIDDLLDFSKLESKLIGTEKTEFQPLDFVNTIVESLRPKLLEKKLALEVNISSHLPVSLVGDVKHIEKIISHLLSNALKFTNKGSIGIAIKTQDNDQKPEDNVSNIIFEISDTGDGISAEEQEAIFNVFTQAEDFLNRKIGGLGLGLAICTRLANVMGGYISCESVQGKGSTFQLHLPLNLALLGNNPSEHTESSVEQKTLEVLETSVALDVLVAEDNPVNRKLMQKMLEIDHHTVTLVNDGKAAVEAASTHKFDLILMDIQMPIMDGITATRLIKKQNEDTTIIAVSAHAEDTNKQECLAAGMNEFLPKPVKLKNLRKTIGRYMFHPNLVQPNSSEHIAPGSDKLL